MPVIAPALGAPCWFELGSSDPPASLAFYSALFGWQSAGQNLGEMDSYIVLSHANGAVGALCGLPPGSAGRRSAWGVYFLVANVDASVAQARALGAQLVFDPFDVPGMGRGACLSDPGGAVFSLWQPASSVGGGLAMFEAQAVGWVELATRDAPGMADFYARLLGWTTTRSPIPVPGAGDYLEYAVAGTRYGGILPMTKAWGDLPAHWSLYVLVDDVDACLQRTTALGGHVCMPAFDVPGVGRIARIDDPTGAGLYVIRMAART